MDAVDQKQEPTKRMLILVRKIHSDRLTHSRRVLADMRKLSGLAPFDANEAMKRKDGKR